MHQIHTDFHFCIFVFLYFFNFIIIFLCVCVCVLKITPFKPDKGFKVELEIGVTVA